MANELAPITRQVLATRSRNPRAMAPELIVAEFAKLKVTSEITTDVASALSRAISLAEENGLVCVTGSLFVVAEALENLNNSGLTGEK